MAANDLHTRACGAVHSDGVVCMLQVYAEPGCCSDKIYPHEGPHECIVRHGEKAVVTHRWVEITKLVELPFDAFSPSGSEEAKKSIAEFEEALEASSDGSGAASA